MESSSCCSPKLIILVIFVVGVFCLSLLGTAPSEPRMPGVSAAPALVLPRIVKKAPEMPVKAEEITEEKEEAATETEESWD